VLEPAYDSVLDAVGRTPMVRLRRMEAPGSAGIFAKLENLEPGGSIKTRTALGMIEAAEREGRLRPGSVLVEATSGNQGIAVAQIAAVKGYRARIVMPENMSLERRRLVELYGAEVVLTPVGADVRETFETCIAQARAIADADPDAVWLQQFDNAANPEIHYRTTGPEIFEQLGGRIDAFVAGVGTGGTITGVGRYLKERLPNVRIVAVEPSEAPAATGGLIGSHRQQGIGDGFIPCNCDVNVIDEWLTVSDEDALDTARRLARAEGLAVGISSGSNVAAALRVAADLGEERRVVTVLPDTAERYLSMDL
jgi:cysteine synthase A